MYWILIILLLFFGQAVLYNLIFALAALFTSGSRPAKRKIISHANRFAIFIPAYKEDQVIISTVQNVLNQRYPEALYDIYVVADSLQRHTLEVLRTFPIRVIEVSFEQSSKGKALRKALAVVENTYPEEYDATVMLDADNHLEFDFLHKSNDAFNQGNLVIQAHRTAKNLDTQFARLDALSEEINNTIYRKGAYALGFSSALIGSGITMEYSLYKKYINCSKALGGFDKELEINLIEDGIRIAYLEDAYVYDEKVSSSQVFDRQRTRWVAAQITYAKRLVFPSLRDLFLKGNLDYFQKAIQYFLPPRLIMVGMLPLLTALSFMLQIDQWPVWLALTLLNAITLFMAIPHHLLRKDIFWALIQLPRAFYGMISSLFKLRRASKSFIHTPHSTH